MITLLPPPEETCQECGVVHEPEEPHNAQSLHYVMKFILDHGREPTWADAMAHCTEAVRNAWTPLLLERGAVIGEVMGGRWRGKPTVTTYSVEEGT